MDRTPKMVEAAVKRVRAGYNVCIVVNERNQIKRVWEMVLSHIAPNERKVATNNRVIVLDRAELIIQSIKEVKIDWEKMTLQNKIRELFIDPIVIETKFYKMLEALNGR